jgi:hypothetical protein
MPGTLITKATSFGALTDHFGILAIVHGAGTLDDILKLVDSSATPRAQSRADALDENEDVAASAWSGNSDGSIEEISSTFALVSGSMSLADLDIGELVAGIVAESIEVKTANGAWPQITVTGLKGLETITAPTGFLNKFTLPAITVYGQKQAQVLGFTVTTGRLTGSGISFKCTLAEQLDGVGEPAAHGVSGGTGEVTAEFVDISGAPVWAIAAVLADSAAAAKFMGEVTQVPGETEPQANWHTASGKIEFICPRQASA